MVLVFLLEVYASTLLRSKNIHFTLQTLALSSAHTPRALLKHSALAKVHLLEKA